MAQCGTGGLSGPADRFLSPAVRRVQALKTCFCQRGCDRPGAKSKKAGKRSGKYVMVQTADCLTRRENQTEKMAGL